MSLSEVYVWMYAILTLLAVGFVVVQYRVARARARLSDATELSRQLELREASVQPKTLAPKPAKSRGSVAGEGGIEALTIREREVLKLVAGAMSSKQIGRELGLSSHTVDWHIDKARRRLGASTRYEAAQLASERPPASGGRR